MCYFIIPNCSFCVCVCVGVWYIWFGLFVWYPLIRHLSLPFFSRHHQHHHHHLFTLIFVSLPLYNSINCFVFFLVFWTFITLNNDENMKKNSNVNSIFYNTTTLLFFGISFSPVTYVQYGQKKIETTKRVQW